MARDKTNKLPALQFYPGDWRKDIGVQSLSFHDRGVWFELLMLMHESECRGALVLSGKPMSDDAVARVLGMPSASLKKTVSTLLDTGVASRREDGALICRRMVKDEALRQTRKACGSLGGNPNLVGNLDKQKNNQPQNQTSTPSSSTSFSTSVDGSQSSLLMETIALAHPRAVSFRWTPVSIPQSVLNAIFEAAQSHPLEEILAKTQAFSAEVAKWPAEERQFLSSPENFFRRLEFNRPLEEIRKPNAKAEVKPRSAASKLVQ